MYKFPVILANPQSIANRSPVYGVGINDAGYQTQPTINGKRLRCPFYSRWKSMLERCYSKKMLAKYPTYNGCSVSNEWLRFSVFKDWMASQNWEGNDLDKDIIIKGNKIYSADACAFILQSTNKVLNPYSARIGKFLIGVRWDASMKKYQARVRKNGKRVNLGYFSSEEEASKSWRKAKSEQLLMASKNEKNTMVVAALVSRAEELKDFNMGVDCFG